MSLITVVILTFNEELHLQRCLDSARSLTDDIVVVDSFSTDATVDIVKHNKVRLLEHAWENNHSRQFNWALTQLPDSTQWVCRLDADEILSPLLVKEIKFAITGGLTGKGAKPIQANGLWCQRSLVFQGQLLRFGGMAANHTLRIFRFGYGQSESRWMDERIVVSGPTQFIPGEIIDNNLNDLNWWLEKHRNYAKRAAVDLLGKKYPLEFVGTPSQHNFKELTFKERLYAVLPPYSRGLVFFLYRYIARFGFLDGLKGARFYYFQTFWFRNLIDMHVNEVESLIRKHSLSPSTAIEKALGIQLL